MISFACSTCGKQLKVKDDLLAKKVKPTLEVLEDRTMPSSFNPSDPRGHSLALTLGLTLRRGLSLVGGVKVVTFRRLPPTG
jgi:hypothetical protein